MKKLSISWHSILGKIKNYLNRVLVRIHFFFAAATTFADNLRSCTCVGFVQTFIAIDSSTLVQAFRRLDDNNNNQLIHSTANTFMCSFEQHKKVIDCRVALSFSAFTFYHYQTNGESCATIKVNCKRHNNLALLYRVQKKQNKQKKAHGECSRRQRMLSSKEGKGEIEIKFSDTTFIHIPSHGCIFEFCFGAPISFQ